MSDYKPGDIVRLKSSPQKMTVAAVSDDVIACVWVSDFGDPHRETYVADALMLDDGEGDRQIKEVLKRKPEKETEF